MCPQSPIVHYGPSENSGNRRPRGARSRSSVYPRVQRETSIPLPHHRLSPLIDNEEPLPDVPFAMKLAPTLTWGEWRLFPTLGTSQQRRRTSDALLMTATSPEVEELLMMVGTTGQSMHQMVKIQPRANGAIVSVSDVIEAVEEVWHNTQQFVSAGGLVQSFGRNRDGKLFWRGLKKEEDDNGVLILMLRI